MRTNILILCGLFVLPSCATLRKLSEGAPGFAGREAYDARVKALTEKHTLADQCAEKGAGKDEKAGVVEVVAHPDGKITARSMLWPGTPAVEACVIEAAQKATLPPQPGIPVATLWDFRPMEIRPKDPPAPDLPEPIQNKAGLFQEEVEGQCGFKLPPDFYVSIEVGFNVFPGGKVGAVNVINSNAKDGDFESCVMKLMGGKTMPDLGYDGAVPVSFRFKLGLKTISGGM